MGANLLAGDLVVDDHLGGIVRGIGGCMGGLFGVSVAMAMLVVDGLLRR